MSYKSPRFIVIASAILIFIISLAVTLIPLAVTGKPNFNFTLSLPTALFSFAAIPLFIIGLRDFTHELRRAYTLLCIGIVFYSLGQLQFPLFELINGTFWVNSGGVIVPFALSICLIFFGMRRFGRLLRLHDFWLSPWAAFGTAIIGGAVIALTLHSTILVELIFEMGLAIVLFFAAMIGVRIRSVAAARYHRSLVWTIAGVGMLSFAALHHVIMVMILPTNSWYLNSWIFLWPTITSAILFWQAGYSFTQITATDNSAAPVHATPVDVITYVASLASNPRDIDKPIDELRVLTAMADTATISRDQEAKLVSIYNQLESYLVNQEPLQRFDPRSLREVIRTRFDINPSSNPSFWGLFTEESVAMPQATPHTQTQS